MISTRQRENEPFTLAMSFACGEHYRYKLIFLVGAYTYNRVRIGNWVLRPISLLRRFKRAFIFYNFFFFFYKKGPTIFQLLIKNIRINDKLVVSN